MIKTRLTDVNKQFEPQTRASGLQVLDHGFSLLIKTMAQKKIKNWMRWIGIATVNYMLLWYSYLL